MMSYLLTAIYAKLSGSAIHTDVGGRVYLDQSPDKPTFPYVVFFVVSSVPDQNIFDENFSNTIIQFSLVSSSSSVTEISKMYADLKLLYDGCSLTITGSTLLWMKETNLVTIVDEIPTTTGTTKVKVWHVDYEIFTNLN